MSASPHGRRASGGGLSRSASWFSTMHVAVGRHGRFRYTSAAEDDGEARFSLVSAVEEIAGRQC